MFKWLFGEEKKPYWKQYCEWEGCTVPPKNTIAYSDWLSEQTRRMNDLHSTDSRNTKEKG